MWYKQSMVLLYIFSEQRMCPTWYILVRGLPWSSEWRFLTSPDITGGATVKGLACASSNNTGEKNTKFFMVQLNGKA